MKESGEIVYSSDSNEWETPQWLFDLLNVEFMFELDPSANDNNAKCDLYYTNCENGLSVPWAPYTVFCNPPYSPWQTAYKWVKKAYEEGKSTTVVQLLPARTSNKWFHEYVMYAKEIRFISGRIKFIGGKYFAPFPSMIVIFAPGNHWPVIGEPIVIQE